MADEVNESLGAQDTINLPEASAQVGERPPEGSAQESDDDIVNEAKERFKLCKSWESNARDHWLDDLKFAEGDIYNQYQWPDAIRRSRELDERPCLTINKTRQHNLQIINEAKRNKPAIKFRACGGGATVDSARVLNAIVRNIEYVSKAQVAYDKGTEYQVKAGKGYLRIITEYEDNTSFNQRPKIEMVFDPLTIFIDKDAREMDRSDARYGFAYEDMPLDRFKAKWPQYANIATTQTLDDSGFGWRQDNFVRMAEYYRKVEKDDTLYAIPGPNGPVAFRASELQSPELIAQIESTPGVKKRPTKNEVIEYYTIVGNTIVDRGIWIGKYIPLIPIIGEETIIDGQYDCKGHTRALIDPQRMYNYMSSSSVEYSGLQTKAPYKAPVQAIEGLETYWENANKINYAVLPYNGMDDAGNPIAAPEREQPPVPMPAALEGMKIASAEMMMASGQYEAEFGQKTNERSAKAIDERERASGTSTYHFVDHLAIAVRAVGMQILDLIPKLYDTQRIMQVMAEDGTSYEVMIDPNAQQAIQIRAAADANAAMQVIFNPKVGKYDVQADVGPDWGTQRQETFHALSLILTQSPQLTAIIGDLLLQSSDFELAQEAAARLKRLVPKAALGLGPSAEEQAMQQQIETLSSLLKQTMEELAKERVKVKGKDALRQVDAFRAYTERLKAVAEAAEKAGKAISAQDLARVANQVIGEMMQLDLDDVVEATEPTLRASALRGQLSLDLPPVNGARRAKDGNWYVGDREKGFARVE